MINWLNYQHLYYFWSVVRAGTITAAARDLRLAQPTLSAQLQILEAHTGVKLFKKDGRRLQLTEAGKLAFSYAEKIFILGNELLDQLEGNVFLNSEIIRIGISDVIPKMLSYRIIEPLNSLSTPPRLVCLEGNATQLIASLSIRDLDVVISDTPLPASVRTKLFSHRLGISDMSFVASKKLLRKFKIKDATDLSGVPLLLPALSSSSRAAIDSWLNDLSIAVHVVGEFQDTALMKIFGSHGHGVFPIPSAIENEICSELDVVVVVRAPIKQSYYLIATEKKLTNKSVAHLYDAAAKDIFGQQNQSLKSKKRSSPTTKA